MAFEIPLLAGEQARDVFPTSVDLTERRIARQRENTRGGSAWTLISSGAVDTTRSRGLFPAGSDEPLPRQGTRISWLVAAASTTTTTVGGMAARWQKEIDGNGLANPNSSGFPDGSAFPLRRLRRPPRPRNPDKRYYDYYRCVRRKSFGTRVYGLLRSGFSAEAIYLLGIRCSIPPCTVTF